MLLNITTTHQPTTDLSYLLHKHPDRFQSVDLSVGQAHIFYPELSQDKTTVSLLLDIDPIDMVRSGKNFAGEGFALGQYVNDRPYVVSSFMSVAIAKAFSTAMNGICNHHPELLGIEMPFQVVLHSIPAPQGGDGLIRRLFEPLGYKVSVVRHTLDTQFPQWGQSRYFTVTLEHTLTLQNLLTHLYVLIPTLDNDKHYFITASEIDKLLSKGQGWLNNHPEKEQISSRYLGNFKSLTQTAIERLSAENPNSAPAHQHSDLFIDETLLQKEQKLYKQSLHKLRLEKVKEQLLLSGAEKVLDLGCGEGKLLQLLIKEKQFTQITGMDVSYQELIRAKEKLHYDNMAAIQKERVKLFQGSLTYRDQRLQHYDAAAIVEVIEHMELNRLPAFEKAIFGFARPTTVVLTTPNQEYNSVYQNLNPNAMRHNDHRFEWTRAEFQDWAKKVGLEFSYTVEFFSIGDMHPELGASCQMAVFTHHKLTNPQQ